jgi:hypothetical protein
VDSTVVAALIGVSGTVVVAALGFWSTSNVTGKTVKEQRTQTLNERFATAASQLGGDQPPAVQLAGVYAMAVLADDWKENRQTCIDVLCAYLRMPYAPDPGKTAPDEEQRAFRASREVRHTVIRVITAHLKAPASKRAGRKVGAPESWQGYNFDLTHVVFDGGDFGGANFSGGTLDFTAAKFSGGMVSFHGATFSGGLVMFHGAEFYPGTVDFSLAKFTGSLVSFLRAEFFRGGTVSFIGAEFTGDKVTFDEAKFSGGVVSFGIAEFSGGTVDFSKGWRLVIPAGLPLDRHAAPGRAPPIGERSISGLGLEGSRPLAGDRVQGPADLERAAVAQVQQHGLRVLRHQLHDPFFHRGRCHDRHGTARAWRDWQPGQRELRKYPVACGL